MLGKAGRGEGEVEQATCSIKKCLTSHPSQTNGCGESGGIGLGAPNACAKGLQKALKPLLYRGERERDSIQPKYLDEVRKVKRTAMNVKHSNIRKRHLFINRWDSLQTLFL